MKNNQPATHNHKRAGAVVLLESTAILAKVMAPSGDEFWVKLTDLTPLMDSVIEKRKPARKPLGPNRPNASPDSQYHVVRAA